MKTFKVYLVRSIIQVAIMDVEADTLEQAVVLAEVDQADAVWDDDDRLLADVEKVEDSNGLVVWRKP